MQPLLAKHPCSFDPTDVGDAKYSTAPNHFPLNRPDQLTYTFFGTGAVYQAAREAIQQTTDTILLPAYNCGHEVEPVLRAGANVRFYRVNRDTGIDLDHLVSLCDDTTRAILVTHYFGFPQALDELLAVCRERGLLLIEDCAHALYSSDGDNPLGARGDLAVFSFRKSLALPDGGGLVSRRSHALAAPPAVSVWAKRWRLAHKALLYNRSQSPGLARRAAFLGLAPLVAAANSLRSAASAAGSQQHDPDDESFDFAEAPLAWSMSASARETLMATNPCTIIEQRRAHFAAFADMEFWSEELTPLHRSLPAGVCPLYFPLRATHPERLVGTLNAAGLPATIWWQKRHPAVDWKAFADAAYLKDHLVVLPVHQQLQPHDIEAYRAALATAANA